MSLLIRMRWSSFSGRCRDNNLILKIPNTKELIINYRRKKTDIHLFISGDCVERELPGPEHTWGPGLGFKNSSTGKERTAASLFPEGSRGELPHPKASCVLLSLLLREHIDILHLCLVCQLHRSREESTPEHCYHHPEDHWMPSSTPGRSLHFPLPQKSPEHPERSISPRTLSVSTAALRQMFQDIKNKDVVVWCGTPSVCFTCFQVKHTYITLLS